MLIVQSTFKSLILIYLKHWTDGISKALKKRKTRGRPFLTRLVFFRSLEYQNKTLRFFPKTSFAIPLVINLVTFRIKIVRLAVRCSNANQTLTFKGRDHLHPNIMQDKVYVTSGELNSEPTLVLFHGRTRSLTFGNSSISLSRFSICRRPP